MTFIRSTLGLAAAMAVITDIPAPLATPRVEPRQEPRVMRYQTHLNRSKKWPRATSYEDARRQSLLAKGND